MRHRFLAEARHMYQLSHPNVLRVLEVCDRQNGPYFVMPYIQGGSLSERLRRKPPLTPQEIVALATQIAKALAYAHERGIIHRDLKPANVLLDAEGHAYLTDFGLPAPSSMTLSSTPAAVPGGVPRPTCHPRLPPARPKTPVAISTPSARCSTRCSPVACRTWAPRLMLSSAPSSTAPPPAIATLNPSAHVGLATIAQGAMARELHDRYASMADVLADLGRVAAGQQPLGPHGKATRPMGRKLVAIAAMVAVVLAALGGFAWWQDHRAGHQDPHAAVSQPHETPTATDVSTAVSGVPEETGGARLRSSRIGGNARRTTSY